MENGYEKTRINPKVIGAIVSLFIVGIILAIAIPSSMNKGFSIPKNIGQITYENFEEKIDSQEEFVLLIGEDETYKTRGWFENIQVTDTSFSSAPLAKFSDMELIPVYAIIEDSTFDSENTLIDIYSYLLDNDPIADATVTQPAGELDADKFFWIRPSNDIYDNAVVGSSTLGTQNYYDSYMNINSMSETQRLYPVKDLQYGTCEYSDGETVDLIPKFNSNANCFGPTTNNPEVKYNDPALKNYTPDSTSSVSDGFDTLEIGSYYTSISSQVMFIGYRPDGTYGIQAVMMDNSYTMSIESFLSVYNWIYDTDVQPSSSMPGWEIALITISSIAAAGIAGFGGYYYYKNYYKPAHK